MKLDAIIKGGRELNVTIVSFVPLRDNRIVAVCVYPNGDIFLTDPSNLRVDMPLDGR